jgi:glycosyltransferase involved in cell wall biosynthesis
VNSIDILHITPHLGGGVGTVVLNWLRKEYEINTGINHRVACLEENKNSMNEYLDIGLSIFDGMYFKKQLLTEWIAQSDIVLIHWWNHPTLFEIMVNMEFPACRLIFWNHVSALYPPYIHSNKLIEFSDLFVFTSPVSYEAKEIIDLPDYLKEKLDVVWSSCGTDIFRDFKKIDHDGFIIGMTGTVDYGKLHPDFIRMCSNINIPNAKFIVCSGDSQDRIKQDAVRYNIENRFSFNGRVRSVMPFLAIYDVFGYPLQPKHLGTCEQAIGEAMLAGVVPVVLNNAAEKYIIEDGITGIIAKSQDEYCRAIEFLYHNPDKREKMEDRAIASAKGKYSITKKIKKWGKIFGRALDNDKRVRQWNAEKCGSGAAIFIESLGDYGDIFEKYIVASEQNMEREKHEVKSEIIALFKSNSQWYSDNKGGVKQYLRSFSKDYYLRLWDEWLDNNPYK